MLGFRGCRIGVIYPEITRMQAAAIIEAAIELKRERVDVHPEIMVPLTIYPQELEFIIKDVTETADSLIAESGVKLEYRVGTMLETPRSCLVAAELAKLTHFFSFGTNDLTQMTLAISRDDAEKGFIMDYVDKGLLKENPFESLDQIGVGRLMEDAIKNGRASDPDLVIGICGEHGGDPESVKFCHSLGLDYVSCSPYRVPIAILSAAQAALKDKGLKHEAQG
jgi:pyruvate,orthophosphate dikinase